MLKTRRSSKSVAKPSFTQRVAEHEVWVLGTWEHETGHATVKFTGSVEDCVKYRAASSERSKLSVRPTGRNVGDPLIPVEEEPG